MSTESPSKGRRSCLMTALVLIVFVIASALLMLLPTGLIGSVFVMGGVAFFGLLGLHYLVWGRWLSRELRDVEPPPEDEGT